MKYLNKFKILYEHQYGFRSNHNTVHPLLHFLDKINNSLNNDNPEFTLGIFIDLKKAFDTCDKNILLAKLYHYGFRGSVNCWFHSYLTNRKQFTNLNGVSSSLRDMVCGVPQGSILGPILFLILINDLPHCSKHLFTLLFADDTTLQLSSPDPIRLYNTANKELTNVAEWFKANKLTLNISKTKYILFRKPNMNIDFDALKLYIDNCSVERIGGGCAETSFKFVGVKIDEFLQWKNHIQSVKSKLTSANFALSKIKNLLSEDIKLIIYNSLFRSHLEYCIMAWGNTDASQMSQIQNLQKKAIRCVANEKYNAHANPLFIKYKLLNVTDTYFYSLGVFMYRYTNSTLPNSFNDFFKKLQMHDRNLNYVTNRIYSDCLGSIPSNSLPKFWNSLNLDMKRSSSLKIFKKQLKEKFQSYYSTRCNKQNCYSCK